MDNNIAAASGWSTPHAASNTPSRPRSPTLTLSDLSHSVSRDQIKAKPVAGPGPESQQSVYDYQELPLDRNHHASDKPQDEVPPEYRHSYTRDGALPRRVLHLRDRSSGFYDNVNMAEHDVEKVGDSTTSTEDRSSQTSVHVPDGKGKSDNPKAVSDQASDPNVVDWNGPDDPDNPMNWTKKRRYAQVVLASTISFVTPLASSIFAPGVPLLMREFGSTNSLLESFVVSVYLLGFVLGPLVVAPASEIIGRLPVYHAGNLLFAVFCVACAVSTDIPMFCVFRFLQGTAGAVPLTNGGATIADVVPPASRGAALAVWALGPLLGPVVGPVVGGFLSQAKGWRWTFWLLTILSGTLTILGFVLMRETYAPILLERRTKRLRKETGNEKLVSKLDTGLKPREFFQRAMIRPTKMLTRSPIVFLLSLNISICFSYLYLLFTTFTFVFEGVYHFNSGEAGLAYLGLGIGLLLGLPAFGKTADAYYRKQTAKNGEQKPEYRLPALTVGPPLVAIGLIGYGWTADKHVHWIAPILLSMPTGLGLIATFMPTQTYLIDAFGRYAASAVAAQTVLRCLFGALLPLAGEPMYDALGLGWGNTTLAFIALLLWPMPFVFIRYGERIRKRFTIDL